MKKTISSSAKEGKIVKNGQVAVAISRGFGAGWTTWNSEISPFEPKVIKMIQKKKQAQITGEWCEKELGLTGIYCGGADDLEIIWVDEGVAFSINEYDGAESLYMSDSLQYLA